MQRIYLVPVCPECGCDEVDGKFSITPIEDGVRCFKCKHIYPMTMDNSKEVSEEEYKVIIKRPGVFEHLESKEEYEERVGW